MKNGMSLFCLVLVCSVLAVTAAAQSTPDLTIKCSDVKVKGAIETDSYAINNKKAITGDYVDSSGVQHGMILAGKTLTTFDGPAGSTSIAAYGINDSGTAAGWYLDNTGTPQSFTFSKGTLTGIAYPGALYTEANGINASGWVVGMYVDNAGATHGFYFDGKNYKNVDAPGAASYTVVWAINASKTMTVYEIDSSGAYHSFLYDGTTFTPMDVPGAALTVIHGISDKGDLDYTIFDSSSNRHGVLYQSKTGVFTQFDDPKGTNTTRADGINNKDMMVGRYSPGSGTPPNAGFKCTVK